MAYFDNAATTKIKPERVYSAMEYALKEHSVNYGRGQHKLASDAYFIVNETRELIQKLMGAWNKAVIFTPTATESLNISIRGLNWQKDDVAYISPFEHNAVTRTLEFVKKQHGINVKILDVQKDNNEYSWNLKKIEKNFNADAPKMVIVSNASNVIGQVAQVKDLFKLAKKFKAITVLDMAQTAGHRYLEGSVAGFDIVDMAVFSGHKSLYAPFGTSGMLINPQLELAPLLYGGTGFESGNQEMPLDLPQRFEVGSVNVPAIFALNAAVKWRLENQEQIELIEQENAKKLSEILHSFYNKNTHTGVFSVIPKNMPVDEFGVLLSKNDIQVRTGLHCSPLAHKTIGSFPAGTVRFSSSYFTTDQDFIALKKVLMKLGSKGEFSNV